MTLLGGGTRHFNVFLGRVRPNADERPRAAIDSFRRSGKLVRIHTESAGHGSVTKLPASSSPSASRPGRGRQPAYVLDEQIGFMLRQAYQLNSLHFAERFGGDLTPTQWASIAKLCEVGSCSQNHLGRLTAMDAATFKGVVDRLTRRGLIESRPSSTDRRRVLITLTAAGKKVYEQGISRALSVSDDTLRGLKPRERTSLLRLLKRMR